MIEALAAQLSLGIIVFARVGGCLVVMPGFAGARIPARIRLSAALCIAVALLPHVARAAGPVPAVAETAWWSLLLRELLAGLSFGIVGRLYLLAFDMLLMAAANVIGLAAILPAADDTDAPTPLAALVSLGGVLVIVLADLHAVTILALADSYGAVRLGAFDSGAALSSVAEGFGGAMRVALQITAPLLAYGLIVNLGVALVGRAIPQIAVYFVATPLVAAGGLILVYLIVKAQVALFGSGFMGWLHG